MGEGPVLIQRERRGKRTAGQSVKRRVVVKKFHVLGTMHNDSFNLFPCWVVLIPKPSIVCYTQCLHVGGAWRLRLGLYAHLVDSR